MSIEPRPGGVARAVLDTNVIISGLNFVGNERRVLELGQQGGIEVYLSPFILREVLGVLVSKFGWAAPEAEIAIRLMNGWAAIIEPESRISAVTRDEADNRILECAVDSEAEYLVSGDRDLLSLGEFQGVEIVNAASFLQQVRSGQ